MVKTTTDPELQKRLDAVAAEYEREKTQTEPYAHQVAAYPQYVFEFDNYTTRDKESGSKIINTFGSKEYGTIIRKLADGVYLCMVDELDLVVHEPRMAWVAKGK